MHNYSIDAIKVARAIQKDDLSILDGKEFKMRDKIKKKKGRNKHVKKHTLNELGSRMNLLDERMDRLNERMDRFETKLDQIGDALFLLIDRFDYVVKANNLKDLPKQKRAKK